MSLFTILLDYRGGTYLRQIRAGSPVAACRKWARNLEPKHVYKLGESGKRDIVKRLELGSFFAVDDLMNVWCTSAIARGQLALIHVVKTDPLPIAA